MQHRVLNLYAGIGGNRSSWPSSFDVTAVEIDVEIAEIYKDRFKNDTVIAGDAHNYLIENFNNFDLIWSSPPCPSHGQYRHNVGVKAKGYKALYPDMKLYEEIILLKHHAKCSWVIENTISYYQPLITPQKVARHYFWSDFVIPEIVMGADGLRSRNKIIDCEKHVGVSLAKYKIPNKRQILRNCVNAKLGKHIADAYITNLLMGML